MMCCLLPAMPRYSTCLHALCSLLFWAPSCYNSGKIPYFLKSACKAAKLHGNILPDSRTLSRCALLYIYIPNSFAYNHVYAGHIFDTTRCVKNISVKLLNKINNKSFTHLCNRLSLKPGSSSPCFVSSLFFSASCLVDQRVWWGPVFSVCSAAC